MDFNRSADIDTIQNLRDSIVGVTFWIEGYESDSDNTHWFFLLLLFLPTVSLDILSLDNKCVTP